LLNTKTKTKNKVFLNTTNTKKDKKNYIKININKLEKIKKSPKSKMTLILPKTKNKTPNYTPLSKLTLFLKFSQPQQNKHKIYFYKNIIQI
jgi:hypothetical protein